MSETAISSLPPAAPPAVMGRLADRHFKYWIIAPAIFLLLLIGLFPLIYSLVVSFQRITMMEADTSFAGLPTNALLQRPAPLGVAAAHRRSSPSSPCRSSSSSACSWPSSSSSACRGGRSSSRCSCCRRSISPIVAGATWRLLFDNHYRPDQPDRRLVRGPAEATLLWTVNPNLVYPAIIFCEIWQWTPFMFLILLAALSNVDKLADRSGRDRRRGLLAHLLQDRAAGHLAGAWRSRS